MLDRLRKSITALLFGLGAVAGLACAQGGKPPITFKADAPDRYVVVQGDTLWSIAARFTDAPWRWSELWDMNKPQIANPNRIYPGNIIVLDRARGRLAMAPGTIKLSPKARAAGSTEQAVPAIPASAIEPFLSRPLVIEPDGLDKAPTIIGAEEDRVVLTTGYKVYVRGIGDSKEDTWHVYRQGNALVDPDTEKTLGYEAVYLGTARVTRRGEPATVELTNAVQEIQKGDKLVAAGQPVAVEYLPHAPTSFGKGRVISIYGSVGRVGETASQAVIALNRGKADGLEAGHVLALHRYGETVEGGGKSRVKLPDERYGLAFVFRVFDRVSYALVMNVTRPVTPLDVVQAP